MSDSEMTIRVYVINPVTGERTELPAVDVTPVRDNPYDRNRWPACECPQHRAAREPSP